MTPGEKIKTEAIRKEIARLDSIARRLEAKEQRVIHCGSAILKIHKEFCEVDRDPSLSSSVKLEKINRLMARDKEERKFLGMDLIKIMDESFAAKSKADDLRRELQDDLFRIGIRESYMKPNRELDGAPE